MPSLLRRATRRRSPAATGTALDVQRDALEQHAAPLRICRTQLARGDLDVAHHEQFAVARKSQQALVLVENQRGQTASRLLV